ncbi:MAG: proprotein convertase P-domain-containing protein [Dolichospermum sp.]
MISTNVQKWGGVVASLVSILALSSAAEAIIFTSPTGPILTGGRYRIPDNNATGVSASINISGQPNNIASFNSVTISGFTHAFYADLRAFLSNGTTTVQLFRTNVAPDNATFTNDGSIDDVGSNDLSGNYTFATSGNNWYNQSSDPVPSATYASFQPLSAFNGSALDGTWTLNVQDRAKQETGRFSSFSIDVTPVPFESNAAPAAMAIVFGAFLVRRKLQQRSTQKMLAESVDSGLIHEPTVQ